ncbi:hypothetical protein SAMN02982927_03073, partial [Sporolactobacillus nakayamae]
MAQLQITLNERVLHLAPLNLHSREFIPMMGSSRQALCTDPFVSWSFHQL